MTDPLPRAYEPGPPEPDKPQYDTHLDISLDDGDEQLLQARDPVFVDVVAKDDTRHPIIPAALRSRENLRAALRYHVGRIAHRVGYHAVRAVPVYLPKALFWAAIGLFRLTGRQLSWWWDPEVSGLLQEAASNGDLNRGPLIADQLSQRRRVRGLFLLAELAVLTVAGLLFWLMAPAWLVALTVAAAIPGLAHVGRPKTMPIVRPAVVSHRFRRINSDIVLRAYYAAGIGHPEKKDQQVLFGGAMSRDERETGSMVLVDMPYGCTFADVMKVKEKIASGLDVASSQVFLTPDKSSERRHLLFVADQDPLAVKAGVTDLVDGKMRSIWNAVKIGKDERDRLVTLSLMWNSILIGSQPRKGKTFFARLLALFAALDPHTKLLIADGKMSPDWNKFPLVAHRFVVGDNPNPRDDNPLEHFEAMLDEVLEHIDTVNQELSELPVEMCPEGKLTEELHRDPRYPNLKVWVLVLEEFQVYFETVDQDYNKRVAKKLARIQAVGPSAGVVLESSSQKPGGVGAGDVARLFNRYRDNHQVRFALRCGNRIVSEAVLGGEAYSEGFDASALPVGDGKDGTTDYRGIGILYGATDRTPIVRTFLADHGAAEKILLAARGHRERLGTLSGLAAGEKVAREVRDVMADARSVFYAGEAKISWPELAHRMREVMPQHYADLTPEAISAQLRALGVVGANVRDSRHFEKGVGQGFKLESLDAAIKRRELTGAGA